LENETKAYDLGQIFGKSERKIVGISDETCFGVRTANYIPIKG